MFVGEVHSVGGTVVTNNITLVSTLPVKVLVTVLVTIWWNNGHFIA